MAFSMAGMCMECAAYAAVVGAGIAYLMGMSPMNGAIIGGGSALGGVMLQSTFAGATAAA